MRWFKVDFKIKHDIKGRLRVHILQKRMTCSQADKLMFYLQGFSFISCAKVYESTSDAAIFYSGNKESVIKALKDFSYNIDIDESIISNSGRELNSQYKEKLITKTVLYFGGKMFVPYPVRAVYTALRALKYIAKGILCLIKGKIEVSVLDAAAIGVSVLRGEMNTVGSVIYILGVGEILEEWTHKKSVGDIARSMSLNIKKVWLVNDEQEMLVSSSDIQIGDRVVVRMGNVIPFDGVVYSGEALVNQSSLTGEATAVRKEQDGYVYAGTVVEEGEIIITVKESTGSTRFEKIVAMIEDSQKLKSKVENRAEHLADSLVPYTLIGTGIVWALTRNATKALSVLMVDFSCALKLAIPISVLSAIREAGRYGITVKGGKYLESVANSDTIVFDKTGTLTKARPTVKKVYSFCTKSPDEMLRIAACLEEHFPHSMAKAVVRAAKEKGLVHEEMHSKVEYIVAHGIASYINETKVVIGSYHFVFEDEKCTIDEEYNDLFKSLPKEYSHLYLAEDSKLSAVICIEDPLREEAPSVIEALKSAGINKTVMMTGDNNHTAEAIANKTGINEFYSEVLPEDKAAFIEKEKMCGSAVIMVGDGINDSPALSAADVGVAISDGAEIAREIADITIAADSLNEIVTLKVLSDRLMKRIDLNYRLIVGINAFLIVLGIGGFIMPTTSALLHNASTLAISVKSMRNLLQ